MNWLMALPLPRTLHAQATEPPPTCPFIYINNVKERRIPTIHPTLLLEGVRFAWFLLTQKRTVWSVAAVRGPLRGTSAAVNAFFHTTVTFPHSHPGDAPIAA